MKYIRKAKNTKLSGKLHDDFITDTVDVSRDDIVGFQVITTSATTLDFSFDIETSMNGDDWDTTAIWGTNVTADGSIVMYLADNPYAYVRVTGTRSTGSATFKVLGHTKSS